MVLDIVNCWLLFFIIDCCGYNSSSVLDVCEDNVWIVIFDDDCLVFVKVDEEVEWCEVVCCFVWSV